MSELRVVYMDESLAVVDKPAGLVVHPAPSHRGATMVDELSEILGGGEPERPGIVHRLDRGTSGLMVVA
ncbi:MAG TPA: pseudouridine synthase, partial [Solirubrobacterales bacterium]